MALFKIFRGLAENLPEATHDGYAYLTTDEGKFYIDSGDKRILINPNVTADTIPFNTEYTIAELLQYLLDRKTTDFEIHDTQYWQDHIDIISQEGVFYVFSDAIVLQDGKEIPRIKMGDGKAYVIDLPFLDDRYQDHISNTDIHVTLAQKQFWNTKLICSQSNVGNEQVIYQYDTFNF